MPDIETANSARAGEKEGQECGARVCEVNVRTPGCGTLWKRRLDRAREQRVLEQALSASPLLGTLLVAVELWLNFGLCAQLVDSFIFFTPACAMCQIYWGAASVGPNKSILETLSRMCNENENV